jgi:hypothetical protein
VRKVIGALLIGIACASCGIVSAAGSAYYAAVDAAGAVMETIGDELGDRAPLR